MSAKTHNWIIFLLTLSLIGGMAYYTIVSLPYLQTELSDRYLDHDMDSLYGPSGLYGHGIGFLAALLMFMMWFYIIRKRWHRLRGLGRLSQWLKYHMWFGITAPLLAAYHSAFQFDGLIGVMYWAMIAVMLSGIVGRYLYGHIPRRRDGHEMSIQQMNTEKAAKLRELQMEFGISAEDINRLQDMVPKISSHGTLSSLYHLLIFDLQRRRQIRRIMHDFEMKYGAGKQDLVYFKSIIEKQLIMNQRRPLRNPPPISVGFSFVIVFKQK